MIIKDAAREPYGARAIIYSLVLDPERKFRERQLGYLQDYAAPGVFVLTNQLIEEMDGLDIKYRLPLIDIAIPALKQLSLDQYQDFRNNLVALIEIDSRVDLLEWSLQKILFTHLDGQFFKPARTKSRYSRASQIKSEIELLLSVMAHAGHQDQNQIQAAFNAASETLEVPELQLIARNDISLSKLDRALQQLENLKPPVKQLVLMACAASVVNDQIISPTEVELLRAFADVLGCPMPPIIPSQP
jgi:hypothetical protein